MTSALVKKGCFTTRFTPEVAGLLCAPAPVFRRHGNAVAPQRKTQLRAVMAPMFLSSVEESELQTGEGVAVGSLVLVVGATGGVGQLTVRRLLDNGFRVRAVVRDTEKAESIFGSNEPNVEIVKCDMRHEDEIPPVMEGVQAVCSCMGTTAFPSPRWKGDNNPEQTDKIALGNLVKHTPKDVERFVLTSSAGVTRSDQLPFSIMDTFNVLTYRRMAEERLMESGLPWTILRPSRLTDAPYTSTDLNTLMKGTRGDRLSIRMSAEDEFRGEASRIDVAEAIVQCLHLPQTTHHCYAIENVEGKDAPEQDTNKWSELFSSC